MRKAFLTLILVSVTVTLYAQNQSTGTIASKFAWDQPAPVLADAQGYTYKYYPDGAATGIAFAGGVTCSGTATPFVCEVNIPAFTPGSHSISMTATNVAGESAKSTSFAFNFVVTPAIPTNFRIK